MYTENPYLYEYKAQSTKHKLCVQIVDNSSSSSSSSSRIIIYK